MNIVELQRSQFSSASDVLSAAFSCDPILAYFLPKDKAAKLNALKQISRPLLSYGQRYNHAYTTAESPKGVAVWLPPEASQVNLSKLWQLIRSGFLTIPLQVRWDRMGDLLSFFRMELKARDQVVPEPYWYLLVLGVSPDCQGQGIGGKLLQPVLEKADRTNTVCCLETSTESAVRFYQRHGFEIAHTSTFASFLPYWTMKRNPQQNAII